MLKLNTTHNFKTACSLLSDYYVSNKAIYYQDVITHYEQLFEQVSTNHDLSIVMLHDSDLDGCTAGSIFQALFTNYFGIMDRLRIISITHGKPFNDCLSELLHKGTIDSNTIVIVADHALNYAHYKLLNHHCLSALWIDHHPIADDGAGETVVDFESFHVFHLSSSAAAGCLIFGMDIIKQLNQDGHFVIPKEQHQLLEYLVTIIDAYDTFRFDTLPPEVYATAKGINSWFRYGQHNPKAQLSKVFLSLMQPGRPAGDHDHHEALLSQDRNMVFEIFTESEIFYGIQTAIMQGVLEKYVTVHDYHPNEETALRIALTLHSENIDHLLAAALEKHEDVKFAIAAFLDKRGNYRLSIRSRSIEDDCNALAKTFGGGGHAKAAGAGIAVDVFAQFLTQLSFVH